MEAERIIQPYTMNLIRCHQVNLLFHYQITFNGNYCVIRFPMNTLFLLIIFFYEEKQCEIVIVVGFILFFPL